MWKDNKSFFTALIVIVSLALAYLFFSSVVLGAMRRSREAELKGLEKDIRVYFSNRGTPIKKLQADLSARCSEAGGKLDKKRNEFNFELPDDFPKQENEFTGLKYLETLTRIQQDVVQKARLKGLNIPEILDPGGTAAAPPDAQVEELLYRLAMNRVIIETAMQQNLYSVGKIDHSVRLAVGGVPVEVQDQNAFLIEYKARVPVTANYETLCRFINALQSPGKSFLAVTGAKIDRVDDSTVNVELEVTALRINKEGRLAADTRKAGPGGGGPVTPAGKEPGPSGQPVRPRRTY